jgi:hypothetical protein
MVRVLNPTTIPFSTAALKANLPAASGRGCCGTPQNSRIWMRSWVISSSAGAASTNARRGLPVARRDVDNRCDPFRLSGLLLYRACSFKRPKKHLTVGHIWSKSN